MKTTKRVKTKKPSRKSSARTRSSFGAKIVAALRETNEAIARGEKLTVHEYRITVVRTKTLSGGRKKK